MKVRSISDRDKAAQCWNTVVGSRYGCSDLPLGFYSPLNGLPRRRDSGHLTRRVLTTCVSPLLINRLTDDTRPIDQQIHPVPFKERERITEAPHTWVRALIFLQGVAVRYHPKDAPFLLLKAGARQSVSNLKQFRLFTTNVCETPCVNSGNF